MLRRTPAAYAVLACGDALLAATGRQRARWLTKPLLMPTLMIGRDRRTRRALALGGLGDVALLGSSDAAFTAGLASFLAGHLAWVAALRSRGTGRVRERPVLLAGYLAAWLGLNAYLWQRTGRDRWPVLAYSTALLGTALAAADTGDPATAAGGALFLASDTMLALGRFADLPTLPGQEGLVMLSYAAGQALLAGALSPAGRAP